MHGDKVKSWFPSKRSALRRLSFRNLVNTVEGSENGYEGSKPHRDLRGRLATHWLDHCRRRALSRSSAAKSRDQNHHDGVMSDQDGSSRYLTAVTSCRGIKLYPAEIVSQRAWRAEAKRSQRSVGSQHHVLKDTALAITSLVRSRSIRDRSPVLFQRDGPAPVPPSWNIPPRVELHRQSRLSPCTRDYPLSNSPRPVRGFFLAVAVTDFDGVVSPGVIVNFIGGETT